MKGKTNLKLKKLITVDFRKSEITNTKDHGLYDLRPGEAICLVSRKLDQLIVVFCPRDIIVGDENMMVYSSLRFRYGKSRFFSSWTIQDVAHEIGLHFIGFKTFAQKFNELRIFKRSKR